MSTPTDSTGQGRPGAGGSEPRRRYHLLVVAAEEITGPQVRDAVLEHAREHGDGTVVRVLAPALTETRFQHAAGAVDEARERAVERLEHSLEHLREAGLEASGDVGDADLRLAIQDALQTFAADEILIVAHADHAPPLEAQGIEEAEHSFDPPITEIYVSSEDGGGQRIADVEHSGPGRVEDEDEREPRSGNLPPYSVTDVIGIIVAIVGTGVLIVLAANCADETQTNTAGGFGDEGGFDGCDARMLIAGGMALINIAHVVGLLLFQAGPYRGPARTAFSQLSLWGTPLAIIVSLLIG